MTPHNEAKKEDIAKVVIMPGDPLRAKLIAEKYLQNYRLVNQVRNMLAYTGTYKNKQVTVMGHGMGIPSIGIYSYELFKFYDVDTIIRIGSAGSYKQNVEVGDVVITDKAFSYSNYPSDMGVDVKDHFLYPDQHLLSLAQKTAQELNIKYHDCQVFCEDSFYNKFTLEENIQRSHNSDVVEMESTALYANAKLLNKKALTLLTCSDSFVSGKSMSANERQTSLHNMIELALEIAVKL